MTRPTRRGGGLVELVCVTALVFLFAFAVYTLVMAGAAGSTRLLGQDARSDALRVGIAYISMRVRQHDTQDSVRATADTLLLTNGGRQTLIFQRDGQLYEALGRDGAPPDRENASPIAACDRLETHPHANGFTVTLTLGEDSRVLTLGLRSVPGGGAGG